MKRAAASSSLGPEAGESDRKKMKMESHGPEEENKEEQKGEAGKTSKTTPKPFIFFTNKLCPFAQRAWIAALEKEADFNFEHVSLAPNIERDPTLSKSQHFLTKVNPAGTVPAFELACGTPVNDSEVCIRFLEDQYKKQGAPLVPASAVATAKLNEIISSFDAMLFYSFLASTNGKADLEHAARFEKMLKKFISLFSEEGPYALGEQFSLADIIGYPHCLRTEFCLKHYRGYDVFDGPEPWRKKLKTWMAACKSRPSVQTSSMTKEFYVDIYEFYCGAARARGPSEFGK